jgi:hypothetical protein
MTTPGVPAAEPEVVSRLPPGDGQAEHFVGKKLFDYMNGGAELYLAFGFVDIGVRNFEQDATKATVEIYQMGSQDDAYGIYAMAASGKPVDVGVPATLSPGMLSFFKGRFYVRVVAKSDPAKAMDLLSKLGEKVAAGLPGGAKPPAEIARLPPGMNPGSTRFLRGPQTARTIWFDGEGDILLDADTRAVTAFYTQGDEDLQATHVGFKTPSAALKACSALATKLGLKPEVKDASCRATGKTQDDVFTTLAARESALLWVSGAPDQKAAGDLMGKFR